MSKGISGFDTMNSVNTMNLYKSMLGSSNRSSGGIESLLTDYASIKSGSYGKLLRAYYGKQNSSSSVSEANSTQKKEETNTKKELSKYKGKAEELSKSAQALYKDDELFEKKDITKTDAEGNKTTTKDYDRDAINSRVKDFVDSYNDMMKASKESDDAAVRYAAKNTEKRTEAHKNMLDRIGITIDKDGSLKVDEEKLNKAEVSDIKALFSGRGSYAYGIDSNAASVVNYSSSMISDSSLYTNSAKTYPDINPKTIEDYL